MSRKGQITTSDYLPIEEFNRLCESLHNDRLFLWELYCRLQFCTAFRRKDVLSLKWEDILYRDELVKIESKTGKSRLVSFNKSVKKKISELYELLNSPDKDQLVIYNHRWNKPYDKDYINKRLKTFKWKYNINIERFSTHTFRKTFGRFVYESMGRTAEALILLNTIFRHDSVETTKRYIGLRQDEIKQVFNSINY